jgi:hypothetical protein
VGDHHGQVRIDPDRLGARLGLDRLGPWPLRLLWLTLPLLVGPALSAALASHDRPVRLVSEGAAWLVWAGVLVATLVPHPMGLTALRLAVPTLVAVGMWAAFASPNQGVAEIVAPLAALATAAVALAPATTDRFVDGASYGPERRYALRPPGPLLLGPLPLAWALVVVGVMAGPLWLAAGRWATGLLALAVGWPLAAALVRAVHGLSRRWLVFVPAGFVVHDRAALLEPVLIARDNLAGVGPARVDTTATDLSLGAFGLVLEARLRRSVEVALRTGRRTADTTEVTAVLVSPLRPGAVLREAGERRMAIG